MKSLRGVSLFFLVGATGFLAANCSSHGSSRSTDDEDAESGGTAGAFTKPKGSETSGGVGGSTTTTEPAQAGASAETGGSASAGSAGESAVGEGGSAGIANAGATNGGAANAGAANGGASSVGGANGGTGNAGAANGGAGSAGAAGAGGAVVTSCTMDGECGAGRYCQKAADQACDAGAKGECVAYGTGYSPVCGCDGITYGNAKLIVGSPVKIRGAGECSDTDADRCTSTAQCARGKCVTMLTSANACLLKIANQGKCWDIGNTPEDCVNGGGFYRNCADQNGACVSACTIAQQGLKAYPSNARACLLTQPIDTVPIDSKL